jgi:uncharacterized protein YndB with AHSA1/START domain
MTRASELREWNCEQAWTEVRPGGRYHLRWASGYHTVGKFTALEPLQRAAVTWHGSGEPGETAVEVRVEAVDGGTRVTVVHSGFGAGPEWDRPVAESEQGWRTGLENLKSVLETGIDLRVVDRPFLGIYPDQLNAERAAKEGIAVQEGIYVLGSVENTGARAAGLDKGDAIVTIAGMPVPDFPGLTAALAHCKAGDVVEMEIVHGQERRVVPITLGRRPVIGTPASAADLAQALATRVQEVNADLAAAIEGLTEEEASQRPAEGEWSVKEVLAHLSVSERDQNMYIATVATQGWLDGGPENIPGRLAAVLAVTPTVQALLERFFTDEAENIALLRELPAETLAHKARFRRLTETLAYLPLHTWEHADQIKDTIKLVRGH